MMRGRLGWLGVVLVIACGNGRAQQEEPADDGRGQVAARQATGDAPSGGDFVAPGADGWGSAAGLRFLERVLGGARANDPLPLVIMIHGLGDRPRPDWFRGASGITAPLRLIMPQAPTPHHGGFAWFTFRVRDRDSQQLANGIASAAQRLARAIAVLAKHRPTVGRAIVTGFSQGGMLSYALALRHPELVAIAHPIAGLLPEALWPSAPAKPGRTPPIAALHGTDDDIVPIEPARRLTEHLRALHYDAELRQYPGVRHTITKEMESALVDLLNAAAR